MTAAIRSALTIAGSDSGGGAGIQADLKTFAAYGVHGLSVVTALTAQNTRGVSAVHVPPISVLRAQLDAVFADFDIAVVKVGMLADAGVIGCVAEAIERHAPSHVVLDPVMVASSGARLLASEALATLRTRLIPLASILTPNLPEAELLLARSIDRHSADSALTELLALGPRAVLLKGGHMSGGGELEDRLGAGDERAIFCHPRLPLEGHGTGCTLASAIAAGLAQRRTLLDACRDAADFVHGALRHAYYPGGAPLAVLDQLWRLRSDSRP